VTKIDGFALVATRYSSSATSPAQLRYELEGDLEKDPRGSGPEGLVSLLAQTSIWLQTELYVSMPVILPHVVRDNDCRKKLCDIGHTKTKKGNIGELRDLWSTPSPEGYVKDDNSLIKMLSKNLKITSPDATLNGATMGDNWVACHIWPMSETSEPWLNSFVPNLVWLPKPLDVLSDREGHLVQQTLRRTSLERFGAQETSTPVVAKELFDGLRPKPNGGLGFSVRNVFSATAPWSRRRWKKVEDMTRILEARAAGETVEYKSGHSHYDTHIANLEPARVAVLANRLRSYVDDAQKAE
jgi:hypothetical protein